METDKPPKPIVTGGNTEGGWSIVEKTGVWLAVIATLTFILGISTCLWKCWQAKKEENKKNNSEAADDENKSLTEPSEKSTGIAANITETKLDQSCPSHQAGCGDGQADYEFFDIYLVSSSKQTPHVDKMKKMFKRNGWTFTTPFDGKLGVLSMQSVGEAIQACLCVVFLVTKDDRLDSSMEKKDFNMTIEMAYQSKKRGEVIPIRGSKEVELPPQLVCLVGSTIGEDDLEERMIKTLDKLRMKREAQCHSVSVALGVRDGADVTFDSDNTSAACSVALGVRDGADVTFDSDNTSAACSGAPGGRFEADEEEGADVTADSDNTSAASSGNADLTDIYFMELAGQSGSEWEDVVKRYIVQCVQQITPEKNDGEMK